MKLQIAAGQLRLRLSEEELALLAADGSFHHAVPCPDGATAHCRLTLQVDTEAGQCEGDLMDLRVVLPRDAFLAFAAERPRRDGFVFACGPLRIVVEVDVRDSHRVRRMASPAGQSEPS
jgi:hypothetical protein